MNLIDRFFNSFIKYSQNIAFSLHDKELTYTQFLSLVNGSRLLLESQPEFGPQKAVGVFCNESAETYAAVFAIWFSGGIFIPLNPSLPQAVNKDIIQRNNLRIIFSPVSVTPVRDEEGVTILQNERIGSDNRLPLFQWNSDQLLYILTTSGSTGTPKTVPISLQNVEAFTEGFLDLYPELTESDNFLQTYDLTADAAFTGYLIPFLLGATVFPLPEKGFKPFTAAKIMAEKPITWVQVTPALLACLQPFFNSFNLQNIKHFHFGGEPLPADMVNAWRIRIPQAEISNVYGPTETTITATIYKCLPGEGLKIRNNSVSIGKPLKNVTAFIQKSKGSNRGELLLAGEQVMKEYLFTAEQPFKRIDADSPMYYPTGDLVELDDDGNMFFCGRIDEQVKINGYRVDLIEVENKIRSMLPEKGNIAAAAVEKSSGIFQLIVFVEGYKGKGKDIIEKLSSVFPLYKVPSEIVGVEHFPLNASGKADKKLLVHTYLYH